ncbi:MAG: hypothetical protein HYT94_02170 [Parcubacteria group bacterium]|nr:hypothetical protein [Parcubacteria group bacterium]
MKVSDVTKFCAMVLGLVSILTSNVYLGLLGVIVALCFIAEAIKEK